MKGSTATCFASLLSLILVAACATGTTDRSSPAAAAQSATQAANPIILDRFTADPAPLVVGDTLYLYVGHDDADDEQMFNIVDWRVYSTEDMQTWTDHGPIMKPTDFSWAIRDAWASEVVEKDGRFWFYTAVEHNESDMGKAIGVAVSDNPTGPFVDARGTALVSNSMTDGPHWWDDIDPTAFIDDDGTAWLLWGNANCYIARLNDNMIELDSEIGIIDLPFFTEGPWLFKREGLYYLLYAGIDESESENEQVYYATAPSVTGPYEFRGKIMGEAERSFTIHPGVEYFKGNWYFFYHNSAHDIGDREGKLGRRSVRAEHMVFEDDGSIRPIIATDAGLTAPRP